MKKILFTSVVALIIVTTGVYFVVKNAQSTPQTNQIPNQNDDNTSSPILPDTPQQQNLSREDLIEAEWSLDYQNVISGSWKTFGDLSIKRAQSWRVVMVRKSDSQSTVEFPVTDFLMDKEITPAGSYYSNELPSIILINPKLGTLYASFLFGNADFATWAVYETDLEGQNGREVERGSGNAPPENYRFSPDYMALSYTTNETKSLLNQSTNTWEQVGDDKMYFHIVDLLDSRHSVRFLIPHGDDRLSYTDHTYWIPAWRIVNDKTVEFTLYRATGNQGRGYTQISNKELWSYNRNSGDLRLLETIPFNP